jgi:hypothetical protein
VPGHRRAYPLFLHHHDQPNGRAETSVEGFVATSDEPAQPESSNQEQPPADNQGNAPEPGTSVPSEPNVNWMKTESVRNAGESKEDFLQRIDHASDDDRRGGSGTNT